MSTFKCPSEAWYGLRPSVVGCARSMLGWEQPTVDGAANEPETTFHSFNALWQNNYSLVMFTLTVRLKRNKGPPRNNSLRPSNRNGRVQDVALTSSPLMITFQSITNLVRVSSSLSGVGTPISAGKVCTFLRAVPWRICSQGSWHDSRHLFCSHDSMSIDCSAL